MIFHIDKPRHRDQFEVNKIFGPILLIPVLLGKKEFDLGFEKIKSFFILLLVIFVDCGG